MSCFGEENVICPYYEKHNQLNIICEGLINQANYKTLRTFDSNNALKAYMKKYCYSDYRACYAARELDKINEEIKDKRINADILARMEEKKITKVVLARELGISRKQIYRWLKVELSGSRRRRIINALESL